MSLSRVARYSLEQDGKWGSHGHPVVVLFFLTDSEEICGGVFLLFHGFQEYCVARPE